MRRILIVLMAMVLTLPLTAQKKTTATRQSKQRTTAKTTTKRKSQATTTRRKTKTKASASKNAKPTTIKGLRAYFIINGNGGQAKINFGDDETTGIENIVTPTVISNQKVCNLNGQYVGNDLKAMPKGIYIVNGKKVIK